MNQDFVDLLRAFVAHDVRFLIVGAYALGVHGRPRATGDLDVWVEATPANAVRVMQALQQFGAPLEQVTVDDFSRPGIVFQMGLPPLRIDVLTELSAVTFDEAWPDRTRANFGPVAVDVIGRAAFIKNKRATGRPPLNGHQLDHARRVGAGQARDPIAGDGVADAAHRDEVLLVEGVQRLDAELEVAPAEQRTFLATLRSCCWNTGPVTTRSPVAAVAEVVGHFDAVRAVRRREVAAARRAARAVAGR